jgi:hypothetical protein
VIESESLKSNFEKAVRISCNLEFCLKYIKLVRENNPPFYSYNHWRFFEGCLDSKLLKIVCPHEHELIGISNPKETQDSIIIEVFKDHWFRLLKNGSLDEILVQKVSWFKIMKQIFDFILEEEGEPEQSSDEHAQSIIEGIIPENLKNIKDSL